MSKASATARSTTARGPVSPQDIGLVFFDLDGTILADGGRVRPRVTAALRRAHGLGALLAVSSGRPIGMVPAAVRELDVMDYYVCTNGATVFDAAGNLLLDAGMPAELARGIVWALEPLGASWNAFVGGRGIAELRNSTYMIRSHASARATGHGRVRGAALHARRLMRWGARMLFDKSGFRHVVSIVPTLRRASRVEKLGCSFGNAEDTYDAARLLMDAGLEVAVMGSRELEITAPGVTKGTGAAWLARHLGMDADRMIAFGDGANDAPLAGVVGTFVAMGNADPALKAAATCECGTIDNDGVAVWLEERMAGFGDGANTPAGG